MAAPVRNLCEAPTSYSIPEISSPKQTISIRSPATTPLQSPKTMTLRITQAQKQALIDNLQLEVTERARKLRAQYALQAQSLRTRIELRINRIPTSLRQANMGELLAKYQEIKKQEQSVASAGQGASLTTKKPSPDREPVSAPIQRANEVNPTRPRGFKRNSDEMDSSGKENASDPSHLLPNPKKRAKVTTGRASRQAPNPSTVLSPKSSNSRTLPQSPAHSIHDPHKTTLSRPTSPLKPMMPPKLVAPVKSTALAATLNAVSVVISKTKPTRAKMSTIGRKASNSQAPKPTSKPVATRPKRGANNVPTEVRSVSNTSNASATSTGTTITRKGGRMATTSVPPVNKNAVLKTSARSTAKKVATAVEGPAPGRRVLRKRA